MAINFTNFSEESLDQAMGWVSRLRSDQVTEADEADFAIWLRESSEHQAAFDEAMVLWESMGVVASTMSMPSSTTPEDVTGYLSKFPLSDDLSASNDLTENPKDLNSSKKPGVNFGVDSRKKGITASWIMAVAASIFMVGFLFLMDNSPSQSPSIITPQQLLATPDGVKQRFTLSDGSIVELNTNSRVTVEFNNEVRALTLLEGEAFFKVAHNPNKPFVVSTPNSVITAVGTAFNINLHQDNMTVAVTEGLIKVTKPSEYTETQLTNNDTPLLGETFINAGFQLSVDSHGSRGKEAVDLEQITAWREKALVFKDMDLVLALSELNRYLKTPVDISDDSLRKLRISGIFSLEEPEATLEAIITSFELQAYTSPVNNETRLYKRSL